MSKPPTTARHGGTLLRLHNELDELTPSGTLGQKARTAFAWFASTVLGVRFVQIGFSADLGVEVSVVAASAVLTIGLTQIGKLHRRRELRQLIAQAEGDQVSEQLESGTP
jgi:hypothetical protein